MQLEDHETLLNAGGKSRDLLYSHRLVRKTETTQGSTWCMNTIV